MCQIPSNLLHIAVTGHRFIPNDARLGDSIRLVLKEILSTHKEEKIILYSALAEGADQLAAKIALQLEPLKLHVPLPMVVEEYLTDFSSDAGRKGFTDLLDHAEKIIPLGVQSSHTAPYRALGEYLVTHGDILLAVWNGEYNRTIGGTGEVVKAALAAGMPIYWIYSPNLQPGEQNKLNAIKIIGEIEKLNI
jgi:hypothetical protein